MSVFLSVSLFVSVCDLFMCVQACLFVCVSVCVCMRVSACVTVNQNEKVEQKNRWREKRKPVGLKDIGSLWW